MYIRSNAVGVCMYVYTLQCCGYMYVCIYAPMLWVYVCMYVRSNAVGMYVNVIIYRAALA